MRILSLVLLFSFYCVKTHAMLLDEFFSVQDNEFSPLPNLFNDDAVSDYLRAIEDLLKRLEPLPCLEHEIPPLVEEEKEEEEKSQEEFKSFVALTDAHIKRLYEIVDMYYPKGHYSAAQEYGRQQNLKPTTIDGRVKMRVTEIRAGMKALDEPPEEEEEIIIVDDELPANTEVAKKEKTPRFNQLTETHVDQIFALVKAHFPKGHYSEARKYARQHNLNVNTIESRIRKYVKQLKSETQESQKPDESSADPESETEKELSEAMVKWIRDIVDQNYRAGRSVFEAAIRFARVHTELNWISIRTQVKIRLNELEEQRRAAILEENLQNPRKKRRFRPLSGSMLEGDRSSEEAAEFSDSEEALDESP